MSDGELAGGVGKTALGVAMVRARESSRADRLFDDPFAEGFLRAVPGAFDAERRAAAAGVGAVAAWGAAFSAHAVVRTRFFDDYLLHAAGGGVRQVVLLAAGLDTRAYRLGWPDGVRVFELDLPEVLSFKDRVLTERRATPRSQRIGVGLDLRQDWTGRLTRAGLRADEPAVRLAEGLMVYLTAVEAADLLTRVDELSVSGSRMAFEVETLGTEPMRAQARNDPEMGRYAALWKGGMVDPLGWLAARRWRPQIHERTAVAAGYGRPQTDSSTGGFLTATRV